MKKTISILLIITMLLSMIVVSAAPAFAAEPPVEAVGADEVNCGNTTEPGANTSTYENDENWTAISDYEALKAMEEGKSYYLTADITMSESLALIPDLTIDGNGYKIVTTAPVFEDTKNLTIKNLTVEATLVHEDNGQLSALTKQTSDKGWTKVSDSTFSVSITASKNTRAAYIAGVTNNANKGSEFKGVLVDASILVEGNNISKLNGIAGIAGVATATSFENCVVNGSITVSAENAFVSCGAASGGVAGIVGKALATDEEAGGCSFKSCTSNLDFTMNAPAFSGVTAPAEGEVALEIACNNIGGVAGYSSDAAYENCLNTGDITLNSKATGWKVGGVVGASNNDLSINNSQNAGKITCPAAAVVGGIVGIATGSSENTVKIDTALNYGAIQSNKAPAGGIVGEAYVSAGITVSNCLNAGSLLSGSTDACAVAAIVGMAGDNSCAIERCMNLGGIAGGNMELRAPIANGTALSINECYYYEGTIIGSTSNDEGTVIDEETTLKLLEESKYFIDKVELVKAIERLSALSKEDYSRSTWNEMAKKLEAAKKVDAIRLFTVKSGNAVFTDVADLQARIDLALTELLAAENALVASKLHGTNLETAGNVIEPGSKTEEYSAEDSGWTAVATWSELTAALKNGNKKIYLTANIPNATNYNAKTSADGDQLDGAIIDGNGYTITAAVPLFQHTKNTTFQNLTLNVTTEAVAGYCPLAYWATAGYTKAYNVTVNSNVTFTKNTADNQQISGFVIKSGDGSVFENVVVNTTLDMSSADVTKVNSIGGIVGEAVGTTFTNCITTGTIIAGVNASNGNYGNNGIGGIAGKETGNTTFANCTSNVAITVNAPATDNNKCVGGIVGYSDGTTIKHCINNGSITIDGSQAGWLVGGIIGTVKGSLNLGPCQNNGAVNGGAADAAGGIVGYVNSAITSIIYVENNGSVSNKNYAGGAIGYAIGDKAIYVSNFKNNGAVSSEDSSAGGVIGGADAGKTEIIASVNQGAVSAGLNAGGIVGTSDKAGSVLVDRCLNTGRIIAGAAGIAAGIANGGSAALSVKNSVSIGSVEGETVVPVVSGSNIIASNCSYLKSGIPEVVANKLGTALELEDTFKAIEDINAVIDKADFTALLSDTVNYKKEYYVESGWASFEEKLNIAKAIAEIAIFTIEDGEIIFADLESLQAQVDKAYDELLAAKTALTLTHDTRIAAMNAIDAADKLIADSADVVYTTDSWNRLISALAVLREIYNKTNDPGDIAAALVEISAATAGLTKGGTILSGEDFAALSGQDSVFTLGCDITVTQSVPNFKGTLIGNGYTITLNGCALFDELNGATITDLKIVGNAGEAESIMGKASGKITIRNIVADTENLSVAALFDEADAEAKISVVNAIILSDAGVGAIVGDVNCAVIISNALVMADAPAFTGAVNGKASAIESSYLSGKLFINDVGSVYTQASDLASGAVAFFMNEILASVSSDLADFANTYLVQDIGVDALPVIGVAALDGSNVVEAYFDADGNLLGYKNLAGNDEVEEEIEAPVIDLKGLEIAIKNAEGRNETDYTAESFSALKVALAAAKEALKATSQADVDSATSELNAAIGALVRVVVEVENKIDYSKLYLAIDKVSLLKQTAYSAETWANLEAMLTLAIMAKHASSQEEVDKAVAGLENAISSLKTPVAVKDEAPEVEDDQTPADPERKGCGSVIGGVAVVFTAMIALAGVSLKKKEN